MVLFMDVASRPYASFSSTPRIYDRFYGCRIDARGRMHRVSSATRAKRKIAPELTRSLGPKCEGVSLRYLQVFFFTPNDRENSNLISHDAA